jgi:hypothetical protein
MSLPMKQNAGRTFRSYLEDALLDLFEPVMISSRMRSASLIGGPRDVRNGRQGPLKPYSLKVVCRALLLEGTCTYRTSGQHRWVERAEVYSLTDSESCRALYCRIRVHGGVLGVLQQHGQSGHARNSTQLLNRSPVARSESANTRRPRRSGRLAAFRLMRCSYLPKALVTSSVSRYSVTSCTLPLARRKTWQYVLL